MKQPSQPGQELGRYLDQVYAAARTLAAPSWEVYGHWHDDPAELRTEAYYLLQDPLASNSKP